MVGLGVTDEGNRRGRLGELHRENLTRTFDLGGPGSTDGHNVESLFLQEAGNRRLDLVGVVRAALDPKDSGVRLQRDPIDRLFRLRHFVSGADLLRQTLRLRNLFGLFRLRGLRRRLDLLSLHQGGEVLPNLIDDGVTGFLGRVVHEGAHTAIRQGLGDGTHDRGMRSGLAGGLGGLDLGHGLILSGWVCVNLYDSNIRYPHMNVKPFLKKICIFLTLGSDLSQLQIMHIFQT